MIKIYILIGFLIFSIVANAQTEYEFENTDSLVSWIDHSYIRLQEFERIKDKNIIEKKYLELENSNLCNLKEFDKDKNFEIKEIIKLDSFCIRLIVPADSLFDETYEGGYNFDCTKNRSFLNYQSGKISNSLEIELNPNCSEVYGKDEIDIYLFMTEYIKIPVIVIVSNAPAFVPADIYVFNKEKNSYTYYKRLFLY